MMWSIQSTALVLFFISTASSASGSCYDTLADCDAYKINCRFDIIQQYCPKTCGTCPDGPCSVNNGGCDHICREQEGLAVCSCYSGFRLMNDSRMCEDINECTEGPNPCFVGIPSFCVNNVGSYSCQYYSCSEPGYMNYYRSGECCQLKNSSCGMTDSIRSSLNEYNTLTSRHESDARVLGGLAAALKAWPWQAQILFRGGAHCGATLISDRWLTCAAHCFADYAHELMIVYLGQIRSATLQDIDSTRRQQRKISQVIVHDTYDGKYRNDIALVELDEAVEVNDIVSPICLPCGEMPAVGDKCWVTGFGRTEQGPETSETLQEVDVPIVGHEECAEAYLGTYSVNRDSMICAGYPEGERDACLGDSGGPLACQRADSCEWYLAGITSFGRGCGLPGFYGVYTNVVNYEAWIRETLGDDMDACSTQYNPCREFVNIDDECYSKLELCKEFPFYMEANCRLACCQVESGELPSNHCTDEPDVASICQRYSNHCDSPLFGKYMTEKCRKTCNAC